jgi:hypothetical protein
MRFPADPAKNKFVRDYQVIEFEGPAILTQEMMNTYNFNFPFRFIAEELVAQCVYTLFEFEDSQIINQFPEPALLTQIKYHSTYIDDQPIPFRSAWGTALRPAKLPIPWAVEQGTNISVECQVIIPDGGPVIGANLGLKVFFSIRGYQPSDEEFAAIKRRNDLIAIRPYQTFTFQPNGSPFMNGRLGSMSWDANESRQWDINFPMDTFVTKLVGEVFDVTNLTADFSAPTNVPEAMITMALITKSANYMSTRDLFRDIFGTAEFPTMLQPNMQFKQGDFARLILKNNEEGPKKMAPFFSFIGYAPTPGTIRRGDIQRGRVKPESFDPQPMIGGKVK